MRKLTVLLAALLALCLCVPAFAEAPQTIVYWAQWSETETQADVIKDSVARFEADHPEYKVEINWAGREVRDILKTSLDSGIQIDLLEGGYDRMHQMGEEYFLQLDDYVANGPLNDTLLPSLITFARNMVDDSKLYYVPIQPFIGAIFYNMDIFDAAGITAAPETWADFLDACQKIKDAGYDPMTVDDAYVCLLYTNYLGYIKGEEWVTQLLTDKTGALWGDEAVLQMAKAYEDMAAKGYFSATVGSNVFPSAQNGELAVGTTAMYLNGSWLPNEVSAVTGPDFRWGVMFYPAVENGTLDHALMYGCQVYAINAKSQVADGTMMLIEYLCDHQTQQDSVDRAQCMPNIAGITLPASLTEAGARMEEATGALLWNVASATDSEITALVDDAFSRLIAGKITAEDFVAEMQSSFAG